MSNRPMKAPKRKAATAAATADSSTAKPCPAAAYVIHYRRESELTYCELTCVADMSARELSEYPVQELRETLCCQDGSGLHRSQGKVQVYASQQAANRAAGEVFALLLDAYPYKEPESDEDLKVYNLGPVRKPKGCNQYRSSSRKQLSKYCSFTPNGLSTWSCSKDYWLGYKDVGSSKLTVQVQEAELIS